MPNSAIIDSKTRYASPGSDVSRRLRPLRAFLLDYRRNDERFRIGIPMRRRQSRPPMSSASGFLLRASSSAVISLSFRQHPGDQMPRIAIRVNVRDVPKVRLTPTVCFPNSFHERRRKHKELRIRCEPIAQRLPAVEPNDNDEVGIETTDDESGRARSPAALDLDSNGTISIRIGRNQIVSRHVRVGLVAENSI